MCYLDIEALMFCRAFWDIIGKVLMEKYELFKKVSSIALDQYSAWITVKGIYNFLFLVWYRLFLKKKAIF